MPSGYLPGIINPNINPLSEYNPALPIGVGFFLFGKGDPRKYALLARSASEIASKQWNKRLVRL